VIWLAWPKETPKLEKKLDKKITLKTITQAIFLGQISGAFGYTYSILPLSRPSYKPDSAFSLIDINFRQKAMCLFSNTTTDYSNG
jgi:hypothetical protein